LWVYLNVDKVYIFFCLSWAEQDVDPSLFSKELMANASRLVDDQEVRYDPGFLIDKAHTATTSRGSATM